MLFRSKKEGSERKNSVAKKRRLQIILASVLLLVILTTGTAFMAFPKQQSPFAKSIVASVGFPLYYPKALPSGYIIDTSSITSNGQAVLYQIINPGASNATIFVSIQAKPSNFNFNDFYQQKLSDTTAHPTANGQAVVGLYNNGVFGSLVTSSDWIIITTPNEAAASRIQTVLNSLVTAS